MKKTLLLGMAILALTQTTSVAVADPPRPSYPDYYGDNYVSRAINRWFMMGDRLYLLQELGLMGNYYGREVRYVDVRAYADEGGEVLFLVNGFAEGGEQWANVGDNVFRFALPAYNNLLGSDVQSLQVEFRGRFYVRTVGVMLGGRSVYPPFPLPFPFPFPVPGPYPVPNPGPFPGPFPGPNPGPFPGPYPGPNPGPYPGPFPGPYPGPQPF